MLVNVQNNNCDKSHSCLDIHIKQNFLLIFPLISKPKTGN